jgi:hypothetical protein
MGAWGHGLLQNDEMLDGMGDVTGGIAYDIRKLARRRPNEAVAARIGAAVGLLMRLQEGYSFEEEPGEDQPIRAILERQRPAFAKLPPEAARVLTEVLEGKGAELARRDGPPDPRLARALYGERRPDDDRPPIVCPFGVHEPSLFEHPEAARYVQEVADRLVKMADKGFNDDSALNDISDDGGHAVAPVVVLLALEACRVDPDKFASWRARFRAAVAELTEEGPLDDWEERFNEGLETAFAVGIEKFSAC